MALSRFILPFADVGSGIKPSSGAELFFYETGTNVPQDTFNCPDGTTPNSNPVISDSSGLFPDIFTDGTYKVVLKDKNGSQRWEADPVNSATANELIVIARSLNVEDGQVIPSTDTTTVLDDVLYIFDEPAKTTWAVPTLNGLGETIVSVDTDDLVTSGGSYKLGYVETNNYNGGTVQFSTISALQSSAVITPSLDGSMVVTFEPSIKFWKITSTATQTALQNSMYAEALNPNDLSRLNNIYQHEFSRKLRMREGAGVNWYGDSNSDRDTNQVQASFKAAFFLPYGDQFVVDTVYDRATSGFTAEDCYNTFTTNTAATLSVIALGTNDAIYENMASPFAGLESYEKYMRLLIERELAWGKGVLIATPLPVRFDAQFNTYTQLAPTDPFAEHRPDIAVYDGVCRLLAKEYGCALFDSGEWASQYTDARYANATGSIGDGVPFGDPIHLFTPYTESWGRSIAARVMCDNLIRPYHAQPGGAVQIRPNEDPFVAGAGFAATARYEYDASNAHHFAAASGKGTPDWRALRLETGESVGYSFYVTQPMMIHPTFTALNGSTYNLSLLQSTTAESFKQVDIDGQLGSKQGNDGNTSRSAAVVADTVFNKTDAIASFRIMTPGWVMLTCKADVGNLLWSGLEFESIDLFDYRIVPQSSFSVEADGLDLDAENTTRNIYVGDPLAQPVPGNTGWFIETSVRDIDDTIRYQRATTVSVGTTQKVSIRNYAGGSWSAWFAASL